VPAESGKVRGLYIAPRSHYSGLKAAASTPARTPMLLTEAS